MRGQSDNATASAGSAFDIGEPSSRTPWAPSSSASDSSTYAAWARILAPHSKQISNEDRAISLVGIRSDVAVFEVERLLDELDAKGSRNANGE